MVEGKTTVGKRFVEGVLDGFLNLEFTEMGMAFLFLPLSLFINKQWFSPVTPKSVRLTAGNPKQTPG